MLLCPKCAADLIPGAKFCHRCGDSIVEKTKDCPVCQTKNPNSSVFCHDCGFHFDGQKSAPVYKARYAFDFDSGDLTDQVKALFFRSLRQRIAEEHDLNRYSDFVERFYQSRFREVYEVRSGQIATDAHNRWKRFGQDVLPEIDRQVEASFEGLMDYFIIQFCPDLHNFVLPPSILRHEQAKPGKTDMWQLVRDYLDFDREEETVYFDFISMPGDLLANACKSFLLASRKEKVFFICDLSLKGSCKEGFAMTDHGLYWRAPFDRARKVHYTDIQQVKREKDWLTINGDFFTVNQAMNLKMYKLLKKLRGWRPVEAKEQAFSF